MTLPSGLVSVSSSDGEVIRMLWIRLTLPTRRRKASVIRSDTWASFLSVEISMNFLTDCRASSARRSLFSTSRRSLNFRSASSMLFWAETSLAVAGLARASWKSRLANALTCALWASFFLLRKTVILPASGMFRRSALTWLSSSIFLAVSSTKSLMACLAAGRPLDRQCSSLGSSFSSASSTSSEDLGFLILVVSKAFSISRRMSVEPMDFERWVSVSTSRFSSWSASMRDLRTFDSDSAWVRAVLRSFSVSRRKAGPSASDRYWSFRPSTSVLNASSLSLMALLASKSLPPASSYLLLESSSSFAAFCSSLRATSSSCSDFVASAKASLSVDSASLKACSSFA